MSNPNLSFRLSSGGVLLRTKDQSVGPGPIPDEYEDNGMSSVFTFDTLEECDQSQCE